MKRYLVSILINLLVIVIAIILLLFSGKGYSKSLLDISLLLIVIPVLIFLKENLSDNRFLNKYLRITLLFTLGFVIVFFQKNIDLFFGFVSEGNNDLFCVSSVVNKCCLYSVVGLSSFFIGNSIGMSFFKIGSFKKSEKCISLKYISFQKLLFYFFLCTYIYTIAADILSGNYFYNEATMEEAAGSLSNYSNVMIYVIVFTLLTSNVYNCRLNSNKISFYEFISTSGWLFNGALLFYLLLQFMIGDRGPIITIVLAYMLAYFLMSGKKIRMFVAIALVFLGAIMLTTIGQLRHETNILTISDFVSYKNRSEMNSILPATNELAGSYNTLTYSVANVPLKHDFFYGMIQIREIIIAVPFLHRFLPFAFSEITIENSSSDYCSYLIQGYNRTYGNGSSLLADIYLDFGIVGIIIIMIWLGYFIYRLDMEIYYGNNIYWLLTGLIFFSFSLYISRSVLTTPFYYMIPSFIIIYLRKYFRK